MQTMQAAVCDQCGEVTPVYADRSIVRMLNHRREDGGRPGGWCAAGDTEAWHLEERPRAALPA